MDTITIPRAALDLAHHDLAALVRLAALDTATLARGAQAAGAAAGLAPRTMDRRLPDLLASGLLAQAEGGALSLPWRQGDVTSPQADGQGDGTVTGARQGDGQGDAGLTARLDEMAARLTRVEEQARTNAKLVTPLAGADPKRAARLIVLEGAVRRLYADAGLDATWLDPDWRGPDGEQVEQVEVAQVEVEVEPPAPAVEDPAPAPAPAPADDGDLEVDRTPEPIDDDGVTPGALLLQCWMERNCLTQARAAEWLGVTRSALSRWVAGHQPPTAETIAEIEALAGVPAEAWGRGADTPAATVDELAERRGLSDAQAEAVRAILRAGGEAVRGSGTDWQGPRRRVRLRTQVLGALAKRGVVVLDEVEVSALGRGRRARARLVEGVLAAEAATPARVEDAARRVIAAQPGDPRSSAQRFASVEDIALEAGLDLATVKRVLAEGAAAGTWHHAGQHRPYDGADPDLSVEVGGVLYTLWRPIDGGK